MLQKPTPERAAVVRRRTERLATLLDSAVGIPGTRWRVGLDALIGLIPGAGDIVGLLLGAWFLMEGARAGAPSPVLARMAGNIALDALVGVVPVLGDIFDIAFKANRRNARLLGEHLDKVEGVRPPAHNRIGYLMAAAVLAVLGLALYGLWSLALALLAG